MANTVEMEGTSSPGGFSDPGMEASPMSSIISDLSRSTLDSGGTKKRFFQCSKGSCGPSHRTSDQTSEGFAGALHPATCTRHALDMTEVDITMPKENFSNIHDILNKELNRDILRNTLLGEYGHDKENDGAATNNLYIPTPKTRCKKVRCPLENCELNIYDNSHGTSPIVNKDKRRTFHVGAAIQRMSMDSQHSSEPVLRSITSPAAFSGLKSQKINFMRSLSSGYESMDDVNDLMNELIDMEAIDDKPQLPTDISKLLSGDIVAPETSMDCDVSTTPSYSRSNFQARVKWLNSSTPSLSKIRTCLFRSPTTTCSPRTITRRYSYDEKSPMGYCLEAEISPQTTRAYKRTSDEMPADEMAMLKKSRNSFYLNAATPTSASSSALARSKLVLQRSLSETETHANIKWAIHRSATDSDLIGDFSKPCSLPITIGHHPDLKTITSDTLAALLRGEFNDRVNSYKIIDCRYPYEYEGGHISGAVNLYNMDLVERNLLEPLTTAVPKILPDITKRNVLVFHCEFSWERGPSLSRFLRRLDRERNKEHYPALHYPEIYLLHGGYEKFYSEQKDFCLPQNYKPMKHPDHEDEFKFFRSKSKSWQGDKAKGIGQTVVRTNLKRLGL